MESNRYNCTAILVMKFLMSIDRSLSAMYNMSTTLEMLSEAMLQYTVHELQLTREDLHQLQIERQLLSEFVPSPRVHAQNPAMRFKTPITRKLRLASDSSFVS